MAAGGFQAVTERPISGFCCPLCLRQLQVSCATVAHAPAEALGGLALTFLCRTCNSYLGTAFEASAIEALRRGPSHRQVMKVRFGRKGGPMPVHRAVIETDADGNRSLSLEPLGKLDPHVLEDFERHSDEPMQIQFQGESQLPTKLAFLSWAFLALFHKFGYTYALSSCAKPVRDALLDRRPTYGEGFFVRYGDLHPPLRSLVVGLAYVGRPRLEGKGYEDAHYVGLGVQIEKQVVVCLPMGSDPAGDLVKALEDETDEDGIVGVRLVNHPFDELFPRTRGFSFLGVNMPFLFTRSDGSLETTIGTSPDYARATLGTARAPRVSRHGGNRYQAVSRTWTDRVGHPPSTINATDWVPIVASDIEERMASEGAPAGAISLVREQASRLGPSEFVAFAEKALEPHLASHVRDSYRLFVLREDQRESDTLRDEVMVQQVRALLEAGGHENAGVAFSLQLLAYEQSVSDHSIVVSIDGREVIFGGYYSAQTALLAAEVLLPRWLSSDLSFSPPRDW
jgi:hypothetical protein